MLLGDTSYGLELTPCLCLWIVSVVNGSNGCQIPGTRAFFGHEILNGAWSVASGFTLWMLNLGLFINSRIGRRQQQRRQWVRKTTMVMFLLMTWFAPNCDVPHRISDACTHKNPHNVETILGKYKKCFLDFPPHWRSSIYLLDNDEDEEDHAPFVVIDNFQEKFGAAVSFSAQWFPKCIVKMGPRLNLQYCQKYCVF